MTDSAARGPGARSVSGALPRTAPPEGRTLRAWGASDKLRIAALVEHTVQEWREGWGLVAPDAVPSRSPVQVREAARAADDVLQPLANARDAWWQLPRTAGASELGGLLADLSLAMVGEGTPEHGRLSPAPPSDDPRSLASDLVSRAWADLERRLAAALALRTGSPVGAPPREVFSSWSGGVSIALAGWSRQIRLLLAAEAVERSVARPPQRPDSTPRATVTPLWHVLADRTCSVRARLLPFQLDLGLLLSLVPGDVVRTGHGLKRALVLEAGDDPGSASWSGFLGRVGQRRAVEVAPSRESVDAGTPGPPRGDAAKMATEQEIERRSPRHGGRMDNQESSGVGVPPGTVQAIALSELEPKRLQASQAPAAEGGAVLNALRNVKVKLTVCVGSADLTVGELLRVRAQQVIELDQAVEAPVELLLEGQVVARGALVAVEDHFGVRIEELPVPLELPHAGPKVG